MRYVVPFIASISYTVEVEADSKAEAVDRAYREFSYPQPNISNGFDLDEGWEAVCDSRVADKPGSAEAIEEFVDEV